MVVWKKQQTPLHPPPRPTTQDQIEGLRHEMDIPVPKGYFWDGGMRVRTWEGWEKAVSRPQQPCY